MATIIRCVNRSININRIINNRIVLWSSLKTLSFRLLWSSCHNLFVSVWRIKRRMTDTSCLKSQSILDKNFHYDWQQIEPFIMKQKATISWSSNANCFIWKTEILTKNPNLLQWKFSTQILLVSFLNHRKYARGTGSQTSCRHAGVKSIYQLRNPIC